MWDAVIVGGGPVGCFFAEKLARNGFEVAVLEEHEEIGQPMCCAGIVGAEGLKEVELNPKNWALEDLQGAIFYPPSGEPVSLTRDKTEAYVIDRAAFDRDLAERAARAGAKIFLKSRCRDISFKEDEVLLKTDTFPSNKDTSKSVGDKDLFRARLIVGADGAGSLVGRKADLVKKTPTINCAQAEAIAHISVRNVELYFGNEFSPGFFAWIVPAGNVCRVGLGTTDMGATRKLLNFIKKHPIASNKINEKYFSLTTGLIPSSPASKIYGERVILIGDAAGQNKPLTGGGIYMGLACAQLAAEVVRGVLEDEASARNLSKYKKAVDGKFGSEFELGIRARRMFQRMSDDGLDEAFKILGEPNVRNRVLEHADFDHHAELFKAVIKEGPSILRLLGAKGLIKYLRWLFES